MEGLIPGPAERRTTNSVESKTCRASKSETLRLQWLKPGVNELSNWTTIE